MHLQRWTVWYAFSSGDVTGSYFFKNEADNAVAANENHWRDMLRDFFFHKTDDFDLTNMKFQQDGVMYHAACKTITLLYAKFSDHVPCKII